MNSSAFSGLYRGKSVLVTGHTGFKGAWLAEWLLALGARVHGYALESPTEPALFHQLGLADRLQHELGDVRDAAGVRQSVVRAQPDFVFHLAAQALVRASYVQPLETYATNVLGTANVLDALRTLEKPCAAVFITTDKCYENREWVHGYREEDPLGGHDPYSSSKAAAEIAIASWRRAFFREHPVRIASARAGNVIGGGDWALDRIIPDCIRSLQAGQPIAVRNPNATRPWQHVLEPLSGYLGLAALLYGERSEVGDQRSDVGGRRSEVGDQRAEVRGQRSEVGEQKSEVRSQRADVGDQRSEIGNAGTVPSSAFRPPSSGLCPPSTDLRSPTSDLRSPISALCPPISDLRHLTSDLASAFNFGPGHESNRTVAELVAEVLKHWPGRWEDRSDPSAVHEAHFLQLATDKAHALLRWSPVWSFSTAIEQTVRWYRETAQDADPAGARALTSAQIAQYTAQAREQGLPWAASDL